MIFSAVMALFLSGCFEFLKADSATQTRDGFDGHPEKLDWLEQGTGNTVPDPNPPMLPTPVTPSMYQQDA